MKTRNFTKINKKMVGNGLWDNGLYVYSEEVVSFPAGLFEEKAIVEDFEVEHVIHTGERFKKMAKRITVDGQSWIVWGKENPVT